MPRPKWTFSIDLDGILCEPGPPEKYQWAKPKKDNIVKINALYDKGYNVIIHTGRSWANYDLTREWLKDHGVRYTDLVMGKVVAHYYIDDRNSTIEEIEQKFLMDEISGQMREL